ncbi:MAG: AAA family ATPase [Candidatus Binatia bacterium]
MAQETVTHLPPLVSAMLQKEFYPDQPSSVELKQTHISYVFLAGQYVYKVKKPVCFAFLDYSTLERRLHFCREEVRLNRRLAPDTYVGVVSICRDESGLVLREEPSNDPSAAVEYAVKMRLLPEERMLSRLLVEGRVGKEDIRSIVRRLVPFHQSAGTLRAATHGAPEAIRQQVTENFDETRQFVGLTIGSKLFQRLRDYSLDFLSAHAELLDARVRDERVREGHGDLRAEHICLTDEITVFDCIEFSEKLRTCDVASEVAFLAMDLDFLNASELSEELAGGYAETAQDRSLTALLPFYKSYRAHVRGKVESLKSREVEVPKRERKGALIRAQRYFFLAERYVRGTPRPAILIVCGLVATGKSTVARMLGDATGFPLLSSDVVRKRLAHLPPTGRTAAGYREGIYSESFTRSTYQKLLEEAEKPLRAGRGVIIDATFKDPAHRRLFLDSAASAGVPAFFIECRAGEEEILRRLQEREESGDGVSDATRQVYLRQRGEFTPLTDIPDRLHLTVDTESGLFESIENVLEALR